MCVWGGQVSMCGWVMCVCECGVRVGDIWVNDVWGWGGGGGASIYV